MSQKYEMGSQDLAVHGSKRSGVSYKTLAIAVFVTLLVAAAICAAVVVPLFQNRGTNAAEVDIPETSKTTPKPDASVVEIECGKVQGDTENGVHVFKGIPYADPPTARQRWKPPVAKSPENKNCWSGTYEALDFGSMCFQLSNSGSLTGSEDCLHLNVWTPSLDKNAKLPVMFYIHGGSLQVLSGNIPDYSPTAELASDTQAVYVSINYRLSVFGFMALDLLTSESSTNTSGNYGFMDQQLALRWVQKNIRNFGGNPSLVTVFGESSGGTSVVALLASPLSKGLFHRAWIMSSSVLLNRTLVEVSKDNLRFLNNTGCTDIDCLYSLSPEQLFSALPQTGWPSWAADDQLHIPTRGLFNGALSIIDGYVLTDDPLKVFRSGRGMNVPVMLGITIIIALWNGPMAFWCLSLAFSDDRTMSQETDLLELLPNIRTWTMNNYTTHVRNKLTLFSSDIADRALQLYPPSQNVTPEFQLTTLTTDIRVTCPNQVLANALASSSNLRTYRYIVTSFPATPIHIFGGSWASAYAFHMWDTIVFFGGLNTYFPEPSKDNLDFKRIQQQEMIYFARNGFPYSQNWKAYPNSTAVLSSDLDITQGYHMEECQFWLDNGFLSYGWVN